MTKRKPPLILISARFLDWNMCFHLQTSKILVESLLWNDISIYNRWTLWIKRAFWRAAVSCSRLRNLVESDGFGYFITSSGARWKDHLVGGNWLPWIWRFPIHIGNVIIPIDFHIFSEGWPNHQPGNVSYTWWYLVVWGIVERWLSSP